MLPSAGATAAKPIPPRNSFAGHIAHASGRLFTLRGNVTVDVLPRPGPPIKLGQTRSVMVILAGSACGAESRCLSLKGTLHGKLVVHRSNPDRGLRLSIDVRGRLIALGPVSVRGVIYGTGNRSGGHERLDVKLVSHRGSLSIVASSPAVCGFTSPVKQGPCPSPPPAGP